MKKKLQGLLREKGCLSEREIDRFYRQTDKFGNVLVINMANRTERLKKAEETLRKVGLSYLRFVAIVGKELDGSAYAKQFDILRPGELGCLLSHLSIAALAADHPEQNNYTVIFEDDIITSSGKDALRKTFSELEEIDERENIQIVYLGKCLERCGQMVQVKDNIYRAVAPSCCHAYAIKNSFAARVFRDLDNCDRYENSVLNCSYFNRGIDSIYGDYNINGMVSGLVLHPSIFYQDVLSGSSDLRQEFMINYQECNDTNPPCKNEPAPAVCSENPRRTGLLILTIVILIKVILVLLLIWQRGPVARMLKKSSIRRGLILGMLAGILIAGIVILICILRKKNDDKPAWLKSFQKAPTPILKALADYAALPPQTFALNSEMLATKAHRVFNPNGVLARLQDSSSHDGDDVLDIITTSRCFNEKVSYPLIQVFNSKLTKLKYSKMVFVESHRSMKSKDALGYEDMRIFSYHGDFHLIGVNLDRSPINLPSMILVRLDEDLNSEKTWHLKYPPLADVPNKNWSPILLHEKNHYDDQLGFIVNIDPLLIVRRIRRSDGHYSETCEEVYSAPQQTKVERVRNSTITYEWNSIPRSCQEAFQLFARIPDGSSSDDYYRYVLMGHTKYVESDFVEGGWRVLYQHYFVVIDLPTSSRSGLVPLVHLSKPFYVEEHDRPHIEYISGMTFVPRQHKSQEDEIIIMYGLRDDQSKYIKLTASELTNLLSTV